MEAYEIWMQGGATGVLIVLIVYIFRSLMRGDIVLGREYKSLEKKLDETSLKFQDLTSDQKSAADRERSELLARIEVQRKRLDKLMEIEERGSS